MDVQSLRDTLARKETVSCVATPTSVGLGCFCCYNSLLKEALVNVCGSA